jgi:hypothetical protein
MFVLSFRDAAGLAVRRVIPQPTSEPTAMGRQNLRLHQFDQTLAVTPQALILNLKGISKRCGLLG